MGHKIHPGGFRLGINVRHKSRWYADKKRFGNFLIEDQKIRNFVKKNYGFAGIAQIDIERIADTIKVIVLAARPGLIIGRRGAKVDKLSEDLEAVIGHRIKLDIVELEKPELNSQIIAEAIAEQLEKRAPFRRTMRKYAETVNDNGAKGVKIQCAGRLGGAEIARTEKISMGSVPLHTLRAEIDYGAATAILSKGTIGVKVWIFKGEILPGKKKADAATAKKAEGEEQKNAANAQAGQV
jgi:small subunit ribosomal protein S3